MKQFDDNEMGRLVDRFMDGSTTCAEERLLADYFRSGSVAPRLEPYREMIVWLGDGMPAEQVSESESKSTPSRQGRWRRLLAQWAPAVAAAAVVAAVVTIDSSLLSSRNGLTTEDRVTYAGSYVIRNGHKMTDLDEIMPELKHAEELARQQALKADAAAGDASDQATIEAIGEVIDTNDPDVEAALKEALGDSSPVER